MSSGATAPDPEQQRATDLAAETRRVADTLAEATEEKAELLATALSATLSAITGRLESLGGTLDSVGKRLAEVSASSRKTRHLAVGLAVSFTLDIILTVVVSVLSVTALNQGSTLHASQLAACAIGNQSKVEQQQLWGYLFNLSGGAKTSAQKQFLTYVNKTFTPVDCAQVYK